MALESDRLDFLKFYCGRNTSHESYPLNKFLSEQCIVVDQRYSVVQQISRTYSSYSTKTSCPFIRNFLFLEN